MTFSETSQAAVANLTCPYCGAAPGSPCVARPVETRGMSPSWRLAQEPTGRATYAHAARTRPIREGWQLGFRDGTDAIKTAVSGMAERGKTAREIVEWLEKRWTW